MSALKCLVVKSSRGYVDVLKLIGRSIVELWNFIWGGKLSKDGFYMVSYFWSVVLSMITMILESPHNIPMAESLAFTILMEIFIISMCLPLVLFPIYVAVFDCFVDENLKKV